ncbi:unnamed protein product, partial [Ectocarpus sp. 12 AP-2014]
TRVLLHHTPPVPWLLTSPLGYTPLSRHGAYGGCGRRVEDMMVDGHPRQLLAPGSCKAGVGDRGRAVERTERESLLLPLSTGVLEVD